MSRRRRHKREQGSVELNLAAMLDMAFQLLTFFILTFRPAPIEGQLALHMPPPVPQTKVEASSTVDTSGKSEMVQLDIETLHLQVTADDNGEVGTVSVEKTPVVRGPIAGESMGLLEKKLQTVLGTNHVPFDRVQIAVDGKLRYGELMKIIDVCSRQKKSDGEYLRKISFTEL